MLLLLVLLVLLVLGFVDAGVVVVFMLLELRLEDRCREGRLPMMITGLG